MTSALLPLMVWLPLIGAGLVLGVASWGRDWVRRMALTNVLLTFALACWMVVQYDPQKTGPDGRPDLLQMRHEIHWLGSARGAEPQAKLRSMLLQLKTLESKKPRTLEGIDEQRAGVAQLKKDIVDQEAVVAAIGRSVAGPDIRIAFGVDGISLWLIALTALLMIPAVLVSWEVIEDRPAVYYALMLVLESGMLGVFASLDIILFYIFFEFTLIPLFFMIGLWGGSDRRWAARKFFIYTLAGSMLTFLGLLFIVLAHAWMTNSPTLTFQIHDLVRDISLAASQPTPEALFWRNAAPWVFVALFAGFAIKVPLFPFHTWLPLAHVEAPTAGSVLLAGVLLKIGSYGFLRFMLPLVPTTCWHFLPWIAWLSVIGIIYGALLALAQDDIKKLVAYSSVSHMGFCLLGLFSLNAVGITGGLFQMINHGLSTGALFTVVGMLYERYHTRDIEAFGGLMRKFPVMGFLFLVVCFSSIGLPGLNGFTGEVMILAGMFHTKPLYAVLSLSGIILGAWYILDLVRRTWYGRLREPLQHGHGHAPAFAHADAHGPAPSDPPGHGHGHAAHDGPVGSSIPDLNAREIAALTPLIVLIFWIGLAPQFFLTRMEPSIRPIVEILNSARPAGMPEAAAWRDTGE